MNFVIIYYLEESLEIIRFFRRLENVNIQIDKDYLQSYRKNNKNLIISRSPFGIHMVIDTRTLELPNIQIEKLQSLPTGSLMSGGKLVTQQMDFLE